MIHLNCLVIPTLEVIMSALSEREHLQDLGYTYYRI